MAPAMENRKLFFIIKSHWISFLPYQSINASRVYVARPYRDIPVLPGRSKTVKVPCSGSFVVEIEEGVSTITGSSGLALAVRIKKVSSRKETSHIAVMSTVGTCRCGLMFWHNTFSFEFIQVFAFLPYQKIRKARLRQIKSFSCFTSREGVFAPILPIH